MRIDQLETPVVIVDLDRLEANITRFQAYLDQHGIANRPHIKTHKIPEIAHMQLAAGAVGITCAKVGEAARASQPAAPRVCQPLAIPPFAAEDVAIFRLPIECRHTWPLQDRAGM